MSNSVIPYGKQSISQEDIDAVVEVLQSDYLTQGPKVKEFEEAFAKYVGAKYAVAVANGTAALHLNSLALGVKEGDKVITSPITFAASANCIRYCGGEVVFADIDPETYLLDIVKVRSLLEEDKDKNIKGIIPVDFAGRSVDLEAFRELADEFNCWIIEDACHAPGAFFKNNKREKVKAGSGVYADLAIFSFHPVKHIAAGEGGMITTNDEKLYTAISELRTHGITRDTNKYKNAASLAVGDDLSDADDYPGWYMEMQALGYNYRLSDINCALGLSQLKRAEAGLQRRREIAAVYRKAFKDIDQLTDRNYEAGQENNGHGYHLYVIEVEDRLGLYHFLREHNVFCQIHYVPTHLMPYYQERGYKKGQYPAAEQYYGRCLSLPMFPTLTEEEQESVIRLIIEYYQTKS
ncbi:UDP-4-amino-4,6-dideoxy-N-acetyl-beta-L-altrosamine transaminase [Roseivirga pacifica]|uniref:UDP-4-amino-4, 6-dideoxy-N-acetyl-beta-L-altrosamine transaminase n=1 Tax=Roseivirga pacifica TaxID=1267423 RepID=UPI0020948242|nr:UDP-4-amino-4,6-dideoxy-N-acetyl-beta-L-altrosamine transaminase [Roseivirga pacifica]MCO6359480.1 UDP-4-amino-4,6-dideoxy-N-acetyl-beta-L-altrosamine transaminase [Roseivirga pacifica]MCO6366850.1 UDP-4-amino-4,6-dideoxy-N-acetyl-beta-L-altrosamine transaminase [Roseivirga pacifica]MCO6370618.1 UDP-4-amino-4,6-dideoxy-N-acetyl-beta-L-altrosamine transaminase [Roseivirga pacifica]MCO6374506.1 UDP-4-amino-4,6-dideoxy-N-acetyl-beta-L-altrosamine transaminase [Roseivirga pacifica]MCO6379765.1 